jgi:LPS-assembly protein
MGAGNRWVPFGNFSAFTSRGRLMAGFLPEARLSLKAQLLNAAAAIALLTASGQGLVSVANSQTLNDRAAAQQPGQAKSRLLVDAKEIVYDNDREVVQAKGDVQLYYQGRTLEADRVTYDRKTKRVYAEGNAKLTETTGQIVYSDRFELTDDFRDGFIDSLRLVSPDKQKITAARGERIDGETTVFERGTYSACDTCKDNPEKPPLWQVKAQRIIHKNSEQLIYFEDARLEFFGLPVGYIPYFSAPDPTVRRKSGILSPRYGRSTALGYNFSLPIYFALAPNYDVLWTPTAYSRQGLMNQVEWRHRLETGVYNIRAAGIFQADAGAFLTSPFGPNRGRYSEIPATQIIDPTSPLNGSSIRTFQQTGFDKRVFRGSVETTGKFLINKNWTFGWDVALTTDKYFLSQYRVRSESGQINYFKESVSSLYLRGKTDRSYFDLSGYYIQGQTSADWNKQIARVHPTLDYNRRFTPEGIGGELTVDVNAVSLSREQADYVGLPIAGQRFGSTLASPSNWTGGPSLYYLTNGSAYLGCVNYNRTQCLLRGIAGNSNRASATISWRRNFIDPLGQVWTPFVNAQVDAVNYTLNQSSQGIATALNSYSNANQNNFLKSSDSFARATPTIGLEYRYPFVGKLGTSTHIFEPIAQVMASPNEQKIGQAPNEDSQSLIFSDSNIFSINRFSGYDRVEGGVRANVGAQYTATFDNGGYVNLLAGQSFHLAGRNSFAANGANTDLLNTGLNSGLDKQRSDYVGRFAISPAKNMTFVARGRFDEESLKLKRLELLSSFTVGQVSTNLIYTRQDAQPDLGFVRRREAVAVSSSLKLPENWSINGSLLVDLDQYITDRDKALTSTIGSKAYSKSLFRPTSMSVGVSYVDECTTFSLTYIRSKSADLSATNSTGSAVWFRLELKHLGQVNYRSNIGIAPTVDGAR